MFQTFTSCVLPGLPIRRSLCSGRHTTQLAPFGMLKGYYCWNDYSIPNSFYYIQIAKVDFIILHITDAIDVGQG